MESYLQQCRNKFQIRPGVQKISESVTKKTFYLNLIYKK